jgi:putative oxidoreductase
MERYLGKYSPFAFALLRIVSGLMFACHGGQKVFGMFDPSHTHKAALASLFGVGGIIELVGGFLIALGLFGGFAAFLCSGQMAFAYFMAHFSKGFFPIINGGELAVLYCFVFLYIAFHGSGILSIDHLLNRSSATRELR